MHTQHFESLWVLDQYIFISIKCRICFYSRAEMSPPSRDGSPLPAAVGVKRKFDEMDAEVSHTSGQQQNITVKVKSDTRKIQSDPDPFAPYQRKRAWNKVIEDHKKRIQQKCGEQEKISPRQTSNTPKGILPLWDFGGEHEFYTTHQAFLTRRAVYIAVYDISKNLEEEQGRRRRGRIRAVPVEHGPKSHIGMFTDIYYLIL